MKRFWLAILLLSVVAVGYADSSAVASLPGNGQTPLGTVAPADMSLKYLGQLFGSVGGVLHSPGHIELLQELFAIFNKAIVALAIAWTSYTIVTLLFNSAMEGGFITSQRKHAVFIFARLSLGFALLLPLSSGYSALQIMGMKALIEGVDLANKVWDETVYFITKKGIIHNYSDKQEDNVQAMISSKGWKTGPTINGSVVKGDPTGAQAIMYDAICTAYFAKQAPDSPASSGPTYSNPNSGAAQYMYFPSDSSAKGCGSYRLTDSNNNASDSAQASVEQNMVYSMYAAAQDFVNSTLASLTNSTNPGQLSSDQILMAAQNTTAALTSYVTGFQLNQMNNKNSGDSNNTGDTTWEQQAAQQGWLGAGRFYWLISQANWYNVQHQDSTATKQAEIQWPTILPTTSFAMAAQTVFLPSDGDWTNAKGVGINKINNNFNNATYGLIPSTQVQINLQNTYTSAPAGTISYNDDGLCIASKDAGLSYSSNATNFWGNKGIIPVGNSSAGQKSRNYYLVSSMSDSGLVNAASKGALGVCETKDARNNTFDVPILAAFNNKTYGEQCYSAGEGGTYCEPITARDKAEDATGEDYPGIRLCPLNSVTSTVSPATGTPLTDLVGVCNQTVKQYVGVSGLSASTLDNAQFYAKSISDPLGGTSALPDALSKVAYEFNKLETKGSQGLTDPIFFMTQLGTTLLGAAGTLWDEGSQAIYDMSLYEGLFTSIAPGAQVFSGMISWWEPLYIAVGGALFTAGFMLCFYAPLYPFILYLLGAINWLMVCVEFMVALPLVALGVTHPEGHDFLGKAEVALMLTLSACLRPVLMVFGFVGGMIMSFIGFSAVNYMFSSVLLFVFGNMPMLGTKPRGHGAQSYYDHTPAVINTVFGVVTNDWTGGTDQQTSSDLFTGSSTTDILLIPLLMVFYGYIVVEVTHFCFTMIHQLPEQVLRWIGGPVGQDRTQGIADKIQQGMSSASKQAGEIQGKAMMAQGKASGQAIGSSVGTGLQMGADVAKMAAA